MVVHRRAAQPHGRERFGSGSSRQAAPCAGRSKGFRHASGRGRQQVWALGVYLQHPKP